jgi:arylsulfatase A-like enzyme
MRWAYYACISYTDANIGAVVGSLTQLGFTASTVIVVWGDHVRASTLCKTPCFLCSCQGARSGLLQLLCTLHL